MFLFRFLELNILEKKSFNSIQTNSLCQKRKVNTKYTFGKKVSHPRICGCWIIKSTKNYTKTFTFKLSLLGKQTFKNPRYQFLFSGQGTIG